MTNVIAHYEFCPWTVQGDTRVVADDEQWYEPERWDREAKQAGEHRRVLCPVDVFEGPEAMTEEAWQSVDEYARYKLWALTWRTPNLDWLLPTKWPENVVGPKHHIWAPGATANAAGYIARLAGETEAQRFYSSPWPLPNVWLGAITTNQRDADERIPHLLRVPAAKRVIFADPLLEGLDLRPWLYSWRCENCGDMLDLLDPRWRIGDVPQHACGHPQAGAFDSRNFGSLIDWVIVGGESGPDARPCHIEHIRSVVKQCKAANVKVWVTQLGSDPIHWVPSHEYPTDGSDYPMWLEDPNGSDPAEWPEDLKAWEVPEGAK